MRVERCSPCGWSLPGDTKLAAAHDGLQLRVRISDTRSVFSWTSMGYSRATGRLVFEMNLDLNPGSTLQLCFLGEGTLSLWTSVSSFVKRSQR